MVDKPTVTPPKDLPDAAEKTGRSANARASGQEMSSTSYSSYLFGRAGESDKPLWSDSTHGRALIRLISRGIVGAIAMTAVDRVARNQLLNYTPEAIEGWSGWWQANTSQKIAKGYDTVFGKPIQAFVRAIAPAGVTETGLSLKDAYARNATHFRHKSYYFTEAGRMPGHSLGAEIVQVTASFAAGSLGDAATRNIVQVMDPNNVKAWMVNDQGETAKHGEKSHFSLSKWAASTARTSWRVVSKNMGEDWAVALPYVYQMRWQRGLIARAFPNSKLALDNSLNGGSMLVNQQGEVVGDFQAAGALDLHTRFVGYNWYTLMYREAYDAVGRQWGRWADSGYSMKMNVPGNPIVNALDSVGYGARYVVKSFIKANLYMNPAVIPFWAVRVPQSKWRAPAIVSGMEPNQNAFMQTGENPNRMHYGRDLLGHQRPFFGTMDREHTYFQTSEHTPMFVDGHYGTPLRTSALHNGKPYSWDTAKQLMSHDPIGGAFSTMLMPFGWASWKAGNGASRLAHILPQSALMGTHNLAGRERFMRELVDNSFSYTPYMIAKAETALRVDERPADGGLGAMDKAIYKFIDSTVRFDFKKAGQAISEIASNATDMGREVKMREGGEVTTGELRTPMAPEDKPSAKVHQVKRDPNTRERAGDGESQAAGSTDKNWAETVTGQALDARFQPSSQSIH